MGRLYLVRHGETIWNQQGRYQGHTDTNLSQMGRAQSTRLRDALQEVPFSIAYSSDLQRATETAAIILGGRNVPCHHLPELRDRNWGAWEGLTAAEVGEHFPDPWLRQRQFQDELVPPGGEPWPEVLRRVEAFRNRLAQENPETALVVAHLGSLRLLLCLFLGLPPEMRARLRVENGAVCRVEITGGRAVVTAMNDVCHLEGVEE